MSTELEPRVAQRLITEWESLPADDIVRRALDLFHPKIALASSFGAEDIVLIDMLVKANPKARIFTLDTGRLPQETYDLLDTIRARYGVEIDIYFPRSESVERMVREHGVNLFYRAVEFRKLCCNVRKVEPLNRALQTLDAWITGLRRDQAATRAGVPNVEWDTVHGRIKINPLASWSWDDIWSYIRQYSLPYNTLHDRGYPSIGCAPCTRAVHPGEDLRAGRWWWEFDSAAAKECGLHVQ